MNGKGIEIAAKCAPEGSILQDIEKAGLRAVELYTSRVILNDLPRVIKLCKDFSFSYAVHASSDKNGLVEVAELVKNIGAKSVVFHDVYWEDEWQYIVKLFANSGAKLHVENVFSVLGPLKIMRRYGLGRCLDMEHLQIEGAGFFEEAVIPIIRQASHIHLTGYIYGSQLWHTHIHHSPKHSLYLLELLRKSGYSGFVVSEARTSFQTYREFRELNKFYQDWKKGN